MCWSKLANEIRVEDLADDDKTIAVVRRPNVLQIWKNELCHL